MTKLGKKSFDKYAQAGYQCISNLTSTSNFPSEQHGLGKDFQNLMFGSICEDFVKPVLKVNECTEELFSTGLETIGIYVLESSRKNIKILTDSKFDEKVAKQLLSSKELADLGENLCFSSNSNFFENPDKIIF